MANEANTLLQAEQAAMQLIGDLEALQRQTGGFGRARAELEAIRADAQKLIAETTNLTTRAREIITAMGAIGTPELLARIDGTKIEASRASSSATDARHQAGAALEAVRTMSNAASANAQSMRQELDAGFQSMKTLLAEQCGSTSAAVREVGKASAAQVAKAQTRITVALLMSVISSVVSATTLAFVLVRL